MRTVISVQAEVMRIHLTLWLYLLAVRDTVRLKTSSSVLSNSVSGVSSFFRPSLEFTSSFLFFDHFHHLLLRHHNRRRHHLLRLNIILSFFIANIVTFLYSSLSWGSLIFIVPRFRIPQLRIFPLPFLLNFFLPPYMSNFRCICLRVF